MIRANSQPCCLALAGLLGLLVLGPGTAEAGIQGRNRMHVVDKIERRLSRPAQRNARGVGRWSGGATGWLVGRSADGSSGLVLTAYHVHPTQEVGAEISFDGVRARATRWLAGSEELDYALLRVDFPEGAPRQLRPIKLSRRTPEAHERMYTVGYSDPSRLMFTPEYNNFDHSLRDFEDLDPGKIVGRYGRPPKYIAVGNERGGGQVDFIRHLTRVPRLSFVSDLHALPGSSGSPVFSARDHRAIGLIWGGGDSHPKKALRWSDSSWAWRNGTYTVPVHLIVSDVEERLRQGRIEPEQTLLELLGR